MDVRVFDTITPFSDSRAYSTVRKMLVGLLIVMTAPLCCEYLPTILDCSQLSCWFDRASGDMFPVGSRDKLIELDLLAAILRITYCRQC